MAGKLAGRVALVTGAGSGLGLACARRFAAEGATVACLDRDGDAAEAAATSCGGGAVAVPVDITDAAAMEAAAARIEADLGALDVVLANAGIQGEGSAHELSPERWDRVIGVNLTGQFLTVRAVLGSMIERRRGSIVLTAASPGSPGSPASPPTRRPRAASSPSPASSPSTMAATGSGSTASAPARSSRPWSGPPTRPAAAGSRSRSPVAQPRCHSGGWGRPTTSPTSSSSWPARNRAGSPGRRASSMAASPPRCSRANRRPSRRAPGRRLIPRLRPSEVGREGFAGKDTGAAPSSRVGEGR
jgi:NAD(P)-dependent dehydrogenase (short-subunit alcohol dehydrogenase family)